MIDWISGLSTPQLVWLVIGVVVVLLVGAGLLTRALVKRGLRTPWVLNLLNGVAERVVGFVKRPITVVVLDEVADVIRSGHYTENISDALMENRRELKQLVAEKLREDPNVRMVGRLPGYNTVVDQVSETTLRVIVEMLHDPRMDELVSDLLRNNLQQIKVAVRERQHEDVHLKAPDDSAPDRQHQAHDRASRAVPDRSTRE